MEESNEKNQEKNLGFINAAYISDSNYEIPQKGDFTMNDLKNNEKIMDEKRKIEDFDLEGTSSSSEPTEDDPWDLPQLNIKIVPWRGKSINFLLGIKNIVFILFLAHTLVNNLNFVIKLHNAFARCLNILEIGFII